MCIAMKVKFEIDKIAIIKSFHSPLWEEKKIEICYKTVWKPIASIGSQAGFDRLFFNCLSAK